MVDIKMAGLHEGIGRVQERRLLYDVFFRVLFLVRRLYLHHPTIAISPCLNNNRQLDAESGVTEYGTIKHG
jgi:hypothetical protein